MSASLFLFFFVSTSTRENTMLSVDDGHIAISIAAIAPIGNGFHWSTQGKSMKRFHAFVSSATGSIMNFFHILTRAHTFSIFAWQMADIFIHDSYLPSLLDFLFAIRSIDGDVSSKPPHEPEGAGASLSKVWLRHWHRKMWVKILSFSTQTDEASQASQTTSMGQN